MHLKSLEIHGFKSFADKTVFEFAQGVTGIVGPNGCGKSNVVDAIRWVLGETSAKALRGGEMADVIFNGTERRKPLGMAEVTLTMADCEESLKIDYNEVSITRRVFRDGRSEYRINGTICRLRDIHELFMDTGIGRTAYSIMAQGQIDQILSSKPEERRAVFEEAAGITKYKKEKKEALRKLEYTEANLLRVSDVLAEQERRMNSLKRQVAKARRYQTLAADVRVLDTHLGHKRYVELSAERDELLTSIRSLEVHETETEMQLPRAEEEVASARAGARSFDGELARLRGELSEHSHTLNSAEGRITFNNERRAELETRISQNRGDIDDTKEKLAQQEFDFIAANEELDKLNRRIAEEEMRLEAQEEMTRVARGERQQIEAALRQAREVAGRAQTVLATMQAKIEASLAEQAGNRERARQLDDEIQRIALETEESRALQQEIHGEVERTGSQLEELEAAFAAAERTFQATRGDLDGARTAATAAHQIWAQRSARHDAVRQLVDRGEGFEKGTRNVLKGLDSPETFKPGILGVLANFLEAENSCARAIEAALGNYIQAVLVTDHAAAEAIIARLTEAKLGQAALLPQTFVRPAEASQIETLPPGAVAWALDRVKADQAISGVISRLLSNVLIVSDLPTALRLRNDHPQVTIATLAGELVGREGIVRGGGSSGASTSVLELQNEVRALEKEVDGLATADAAAAARVAELEVAIEAGRENVEECRDRLQKQKVELSTLQGQLSLATREVENFESRNQSLERERSDCKLRDETAAESRNELEAELSNSRELLETTETEIRRLQAESDDVAHREETLSETLNELRTSLAVERRAKQAAEEQQRPMEARLSELRNTSIRRETEIETFRQRIEAATQENEALLAEAEMSRLEMGDLKIEIEKKSAGRAELLQAIEAAEATLAELRRAHARTNEQKGREEVSSTKLDLRIENIANTIAERHQVELSSFEPDAHALLAAIASQKGVQARGGQKSSAIEEDGEEPETGEIAAIAAAADEPEAVVIDGTAGEDVLPGEPLGEPDWQFVEASVSDLKRRLDGMGPVNLDAIEEFEELEERFNFVRGQHDDLANSKTELLEVIDRINVETERRFSETFAQVKLNFRDMFKELFGEKGQADLLLVDENDPLESGIEVIAKPPGKKLQSITLLSGGERSMTAVALLFSIYMIKPSPFCVLDELDAPLDESNIGRFVKVLDRFIDRSQFIIVTHSKRTMARADVMYGVTMEEFGVSKPVGMRLTNADDHPRSEATSAAQKAALRLDA